ncbi:hypothetical protein A966_13033 [Brachyspira hampsonii 30446]|uniref:DUF4234 domain-containing protein n=1 Tax=Brachyspira hampsonii 30446 TaxID=1289135 RepID=A0A2U4F4V2_9SPIR|nr:DUF4234 domain-containing protein [Brachyspira hampsonii]EKV55970.1 hypothetical protein A966_13033 [Brachyspira hampsonii 30446]OEJ17921.1 hypothetical protein A9495_06665 [Brachyspira hampsonii]
MGLLNPILLIINPISLILIVWTIGVLIFPTISVIILQNRLNSIWNKIEVKNEDNNGIIPINRIIFSHIITLGIYNLYWIYCTVKNIREFTNINRLSPGLEVILNIFIQFYRIFWLYRYGTIIYKDLPSKVNMDGLIIKQISY